MIDLSLKTIGMPCLLYLSNLPEWESRLSAYVRILKKHGYNMEMIIGSFSQIDTDSLFEGNIDSETVKRLFSGKPVSCANLARENFSEYGYSNELCYSCQFCGKCKNFKLEEEGELIGYLLDNPVKEGAYGDILPSIFKAVFPFYEEAEKKTSYKMMPLMMDFVTVLRGMIDNEKIPAGSTRKSLYDAVIEKLIADTTRGVSKEILNQIGDEFSESILGARALKENEVSGKIDYLNKQVNTAELAQRHEQAVKNSFISKQNDEDIRKVGIDIQIAVSSPATGGKEVEPVKMTYSEGREKSDHAMSLEEIKGLSQANLMDFTGNEVTEPRPWAEVVEEELAKNMVGENTKQEVKKEEPLPSIKQTNKADSVEKKEINTDLFDYNGVLILNPEGAYNSYVLVFNEDVLDLLEVLDKDRNLSVEVAKIDDKYGLLIYSLALAKPHFLGSNCISEYVLKELFSRERYTIYSTSATMISGYLFMNDVSDGADIRSLSAAYVAINNSENQNMAEQIFAYCSEDYSDEIDIYLKRCMSKYPQVFKYLYAEIEKKHKQSVCRVKRNYEVMLGSSLTLSRYFVCDSDNLHRNSYHDSSFFYSPMLKKKGRGTVIKYTFREVKKTKSVDMMLTESIVSHIMDDPFLQKFKLVLLSVRAGELIYYCPYERPESISLMHQEVVEVVQRWFSKMTFSLPLVQVNDDLVVSE